jgi:hypothetical protein
MNNYMNNDMNNNMNTASVMRQQIAEFKLNVYNDNVKQLYLNIRASAQKGCDEYKIPDDIAHNLNLEYDKISTCQIYKELKSLGYDIDCRGMSSSMNYPRFIWISWK